MEVKGVKDVSSTAGDIQVKEVQGVKDDSLAAGNIQPDTSITAVAEGHITPLSSLTSFARPKGRFFERSESEELLKKR